MVVFSTLVLMTLLLVLTLLAFLARRLRLMDFDLFGKLLLNFRKVLVGFSVVLVLSAEKTLERALELRRSLRFWLRWLFVLLVLLETLKFVLSTRSSLGRG
jgi:hypothetical protein